MTYKVVHGDCVEAMRAAAARGNLVDAIVTDPPYHLSTTKRFGKPGSAPPKSEGATGVYKRAAKGFMGKEWDGGGVAFEVDTWRAAFDVLKPGGHLIAFSGSRTYHRMVCAIEDAGFEIRDQIMWLTGQGFPKGHDVAWNMHKMACKVCGPMVEYGHGEQDSERGMRFVRAAYVQTPVYACSECGQVLQPFMSKQGAQEQRAAWSKSEVIWPEQPGMEGRDNLEAVEGQLQRCEACSMSHGVLADGAEGWVHRGTPSGNGAIPWQVANEDGSRPSYRPQSVEQLAGQPDAFRIERRAQESRGFNVALKPAHEPIVLARKPLVGTVAANVLEHGTGAINVDACRIGTEGGMGKVKEQLPDLQSDMGWDTKKFVKDDTVRGRWPANVAHDGSDEVEAEFAKYGESKSTKSKVHKPKKYDGDTVTYAKGLGTVSPDNTFSDSGTASRFFYCAKASKRERGDSRHPTVKPVALMRWLVRLVTPPGGVVLDPFAGTGTTGEAAILEGHRAVLIERDDGYVEDIRNRLQNMGKQSTGSANA